MIEITDPYEIVRGDFFFFMEQTVSGRFQTRGHRLLVVEAGPKRLTIQHLVHPFEGDCEHHHRDHLAMTPDTWKVWRPDD